MRVCKPLLIGAVALLVLTAHAARAEVVDAGADGGVEAGTLTLPTPTVAPPNSPVEAEPTDPTVDDRAVPLVERLEKAVQEGKALAAAPVDAGVPQPAAPPTLLPELSVTLNDTPVFGLRIGRGGSSLEDRVRAAHRALEAAAKDGTADGVRSASRNEVVTIYVGSTPIVQISGEDATAAGDSSVDVHADAVLSAIRDAIGREQRRREISNTAFSISLVVLLGLITVYLLRRFHELADRGAAYLASPARSTSSVRMSSIEVLAPGTLRSLLLIALSVTRWLGSIGVVYAWLIVVLSLFDSTRSYTQQLTGYVVNPLAALMARTAESLPTFVVAITGAVAVTLLVRFVGLYFAGVARGEASLSWVRPDLAMAVSVPVRVGIVISALVFAAPIVTGDEDGALARVGELLLAAFVIASVPLIANASVGMLVLAQRRLRVGERAEIGDRNGRVLGLDLWSVRLEDGSGAELHVPHLLLLFRPMRVFSLVRRVTLEVGAPITTSAEDMLVLLQGAVGEGFEQVTSSLVRIADTTATYTLSARASFPNAETTLLMRVRAALNEKEIAISQLGVVDSTR